MPVRVNTPEVLPDNPVRLSIATFGVVAFVPPLAIATGEISYTVPVVLIGPPVNPVPVPT